jgi:hypothetical protein
MRRRTCTFKQRDIARAVRGAEAAGVEIGVDIDPTTGKISIVPAAGRKNDIDLDQWLSGKLKMRVRLKVINYTTKKLASGEHKTYWYAWRGGPLLIGEPGTPEFIASYNEAIARKVKIPAGVLLSIIQGYQNSEAFKGLAASTRPG